MRVAIIDYGSGNLRSATKAFQRAARDNGISAEIVLTDKAEEVAAADRIVLPGVGAFADCRAGLNAVPGMVEALEEAVHGRGRPFLGICVGMQLLATRGLEYGEHQGLGWIPGEVRPLEAPGLKIPHMGWNDVRAKGHDLLPPDGDAYFVHSYRFAPEDEGVVAATCSYGEEFPAAIISGNVAGVQFHPEKSQGYGLALLGNFIEWSPS